ncbi:YidH family protein [Bdellovibrio bacteriovorus]|uniref:YidH family protein n=1 Tax=Bdellovibrio bacteriovorus TaxID=959 RepID=UPI003AA88A68
MEPERTSNEMAQERTNLSEHRTDLSEHRTELSESRSDLSAVRSHLANERTHLAYMRTGISLVSLGITMNRFSWFLLENKEISRYGGRPFLHDAKNTGLGMVILGCAMLIWSLYRYSQTAKQIESHHYLPAHRSVRIFTLSLIFIGIVSVLWMIMG